MIPHPLITALLCLTAVSPLRAHDLQYSVGGAQAVVIRLAYLGAGPFAFEAYEIYREGEKLPYQVGRTDGQGRIAFLPDRAGTWRVKAFSADGHGIDFKLETDASASPTGFEKTAFERYGGIVTGVALLLGLFGLLSLFLRRKPPS